MRWDWAAGVRNLRSAPAVVPPQSWGFYSYSTRQMKRLHFILYEGTWQFRNASAIMVLRNQRKRCKTSYLAIVKPGGFDDECPFERNCQWMYEKTPKSLSASFDEWWRINFSDYISTYLLYTTELVSISSMNNLFLDSLNLTLGTATKLTNGSYITNNTFIFWFVYFCEQSYYILATLKDIRIKM